MLTLQSSFIYDDDTGPPIEYANINVTYPTFVLSEARDGSSAASFVFTGHGTLSFSQKLTLDTYSCNIPPASIFGESYVAILAAYTSSLLQVNGAIHPSDVSLSLKISYHSNAAANTLDTIYFFKQLKPPPKTTVPENHTPAVTPDVSNGDPLRAEPVVVVGTAPRDPPPTRIPVTAGTQLAGNLPNILMDGDMYLINKSVYQEILARLFPNLRPEDESVLLYLINALLDLTGDVPQLTQDSEASQRKALNDVLSTFDMSESDVYEVLKDNFARFFEFPLKMPPFKLFTLSGTLGFIDEPTSVQPDNFVFFRMSAEYKVAVDQDTRTVVSHYEWDRKGFQKNHMRFFFEDKVIQSNVKDPVIIRIKAYDQTDLYYAEYDPMDRGLQNLDIRVDERLPPGIESSKTLSWASKIRGKIVCLSKSGILKGTVVIQAQKSADSAWQTVSAGTSDKEGNFTIPYKAGQFHAARALTSLDDMPTFMNTDPCAANSISSEFLIILINPPARGGSADGTKEEDCECNADTAVGRLPSQEDLIGSDQFMQDMNGCVNLTVPNRSVREFSYTALIRSSDPDVASYTLSSVEDKVGDFNEVYSLTPNGKIKRHVIDIDNPIRWQDGDSGMRTDLTVSQSVTIATGVILYYRSEFRADGYSLGDLLYSLPLAPGQKRQVVMIDGRHRLVGAESQAISQTDSLANSLLSERDIVDQIGGSIGESLQGSSSSSTSGRSSGFGGSASYGGMIGVSGSSSSSKSKSSSSASQNSERGMSSYFSEVLRQGLVQNASDYRHLNATAVTSVQESQTYNAQTDVVANHNHCHSLTMMYFEVLRHFAVFQELVDADECVFVPLLMTQFTQKNLGKWSDLLASHLLPLPSNTFMKPATFHGADPKHPLLSAFDSAERMRTNWTMVDFPTGRYDEEVIRSIQGYVDLRVDIPRPKTKYDFILSLPIAQVVTKGWFSGIILAMLKLKGEDLQKQKIVDELITIDDNFQSVPPAQCIRIRAFNIPNEIGFDAMEYISASEIDKNMWQAYAKLLEPTSANPEIEMMEHYFKDRLLSEWDNIFNQEIAPKVYRNLVEGLYSDIGDLQFTDLDPYTGGSRNMRVYVSGASSRTRRDIGDHQMKWTLLNRTKELPVEKLYQTPMSFDLLGLRLTYSTDHFNGLLYSGSIIADLLTPYVAGSSIGGLSGELKLRTAVITINAPESAAERRNPRDDDVYLANRLLQHLNANLEYYNRVLWRGLDEGRIYMLLDGFNIETFDDLGHSEGYRSLASVLKNRLISIVGNSLVFPVAPGYRVSQTFIVRDKSQEQSDPLLDYYRSDPVPPYRLSVPTHGVYAEAVMGKCDACEYAKPDSSQDWTKFTTDEPTPFNSVTAPVPQVTPYKADFKDFAPPIVNISNAPAQPEPAVGLGALTSLLGKSNIFQDVTGLTGNQQNAMKTLLSEDDNAKAFAQMASSMITQSHNTSNSGQIMDTIKKANLPPDTAQKLVTDHIQQSIDGGQTKKAELAQKRDENQPSLVEAAVSNAGKAGTAVSASRNITGSGAVSESVHIKPNELGGALAESGHYHVPGMLEEFRLKQIGSMTCWATVATMMISWLQNKSYTPLEAMRLAGDAYVQKYKNNGGLGSNEKEDFLSTLGMTSQFSGSFTPEAYIKWLKDYGPIWVTIDANPSTIDANPGARPSKYFSPHAKLLIGVDSDNIKTGDSTTMTFIDPATGKLVTQKFEDFERSFEEMVTDRKEEIFVQLVHFVKGREEPPTGEGFDMGAGILNFHSPVHESMTLASLIQSSFPTSPSSEVGGKDGGLNEFLRGVVWNDDPATLMFFDSSLNNWVTEWGDLWLLQFGMPPSRFNMTGRSHNGDLQFLHSMANSVGEDAQETLARIKLWMEVMYKLSNLSNHEGIDANTTIANVPIAVPSPHGPLTLESVMSPTFPPADMQTLSYLLTRDTVYFDVKVCRRALGSLMHVIQDSYARGHCRRKLLNKADESPPGSSKFKPGSRFGAIEVFHVYGPNNKETHKTFDDFDKDKMHVNDPASFNDLVGARDAIDKCAKMISFWAHGTKYNEGPRALVDEIFTLAPNVQPATDAV